MTDYLAWLLGLAAETEEDAGDTDLSPSGDPSGLSAHRADPYGPAEAGADGGAEGLFAAVRLWGQPETETEARDPGTSEAVSAGTERSVGAKAAADGGDAAPGVSIFSVSASASRSEARSAVRALYEAARPESLTLEALRQQRRSLTVRQEPTATAPPGGMPAEALDQYFQRDARRYDGAFPLY